MSNQRVSTHIESEICRLYPTTRSQLLAEQFGVTRSTIRNVLKRRGVPLKPKHVGNKYDFDVHFFDKIDTEVKAYFLGLLYADGNHYPKTRKVSIELHSKDVDILEKFKIAIGSNHPLYPWKRTTKVSKEEHLYYTLGLCNAHFSGRCQELGLVAAKSLILGPPPEGTIPDNLLHHFVRGYFDGDGSLTLMLDRVPRVCRTSIIGTTAFCEWCRDVVKQATQQPEVGSVFVNNITKGMSYYRTAGVPSMSAFLNFIYRDATIYLDRKYQKYQEFIANTKVLQRQAHAQSRFFGVQVTKVRYIAAAHYEGKNRYVGTFDSEQEAAIAYDQWCINHGYNLHKLNFPIENYQPQPIPCLTPSTPSSSLLNEPA